MKFERRIATYELVLMLLIELLIIPLMFPSGIDVYGAWDVGVILSELVIMVPALVLTVIWYFTNMWKADNDPEYVPITLSERLMFKSVKIRTVFLTVLFAIVLGPITSLLNSISMLFVDNVVIEQGEEILSLPAGVALFLMAIYGPMCEEFAFRGIVYGGFRRYCKPRAAVIVSGLIFGLMHLNFNQFSYAFAIGIAMALLVEASGSIWTSFILHMIINGTSGVYMFLLDNYSGSSFMELAEADMANTEMMIPSIIILAFISIVCFFIARKILNVIARVEGREDISTLMRYSREYKGGPIFSVLLVVTMAICAYLTVFNS